MTLPFGLGTLPLPDWLPWWVPILVLIPVVLYALLVLAVPFSVFGTRGRLEAIEDRLDDIHAELRLLALRLPAGPHDDLPPIRVHDDDRRDRPAAGFPARGPKGPLRAEPRFD